MKRPVLSDQLTEFAAEQQKRFDSLTSPEVRKLQGHFGTSPPIAHFMASMFSDEREDPIRILDAGAGVGTLSAAICDQVLDSSASRQLTFELWENDPALIPFLDQTMRQCQIELSEAGHRLEYEIKADDFILGNKQNSLFNRGPQASFHQAILNPPYFKLRKESPQAQVMEHVVHGQPNIYTLFMAVAADLLLPGGEMVAITPRSYFNGSYFKRFRRWFFDRLSVRQIHIFESRSDAFKEDAVLQENVIVRFEKGGRPEDVVLTSSQGRDLIDVQQTTLPYESVLDQSTGDKVLRVTTSTLEHEIVTVLDQLPDRFRDLGLEISTGPVVTFRSTKFLREDRGPSTAPLLWMHNVRPFITQMAEKVGKPTHIEVSELSKKLLVPAKTYVLLKRFTAKEEKRRLVAGIMNPSDSYSEWVGLENHLNYVYRRGGELSVSEALGLAAYFNSAIVDYYFRAISGNTQVNATEIRSMPIPSEDILVQIGTSIGLLSSRDSIEIDRVVCCALGLTRQLINQILEVTL